MKYLYGFIIGLCLIGFTNFGFAGARINAYGNVTYPTQQQGTYQGSSGSTYQYDLNNPVDADRYSTDTGAQIRDMTNGSNPGSLIDHSHGQKGGGIYGQ